MLEIITGAIVGGVAGYLIGMASTKEPSEEVMLARLISLRVDRYIAAVAEVKVKEEVKDAAKAQATEKLAQQGVTPTQP